VRRLPCRPPITHPYPRKFAFVFTAVGDSSATPHKNEAIALRTAAELPVVRCRRNANG
jgi:hypothetical protein